MNFGAEMPKPNKNEDEKVHITIPQIGEVEIPDDHVGYGEEELRKDLRESIIDKHIKVADNILNNSPSRDQINEQISVLLKDMEEIDKNPLNSEKDVLSKEKIEESIASLKQAKGKMLLEATG